MKWSTLAVLLLLGACAQEVEEQVEERNEAQPATAGVETAAQTSPPPTPAAALTPLHMDQWARNCALCHVRGEGGAPVLGDAAAWAPRLAQGEDALLQHTVEGLNNMPPLGYCMDCETEDFLVLIRFMGGVR